MTDTKWQKPDGLLEHVEKTQAVVSKLREALRSDAKKSIETLKKMAEVELQRQRQAGVRRG